jgi:ADP-heptose:LPS heptosyltransferase
MQIMKTEGIAEDIARIAVVRTDRLGDMVLTLPMCAAIKEALPSAQVILIARSYVKPLLFECEAIDSAVYIEDFENDFIEIFSSVQPQVVFFPRPKFNEVFGAFKADVPIRIGTSYRLYSILFTHKIKEHRKISLYNEAEYNLHMVETFFNKRLELRYVPIKVNPTAKVKVIGLLDTLNIDLNNFIVLHPGSGGSTKVWPVELFGELAEILLKHGFDVILTGSKFESQLGQTILHKAPEAINLIGRLDLYQTIALLSLARGFVSNSTGILHIASVLGIPTVGIFPNTPHLSAKRWGPIGPFSTTISPQTTEPEKFDDMSLVPPQLVYKELSLLISRKMTESAS